MPHPENWITEPQDEPQVGPSTPSGVTSAYEPCRSVAAVGYLTRAVKRAQMVVDGELPPVTERRAVNGPCGV